MKDDAVYGSSVFARDNFNDFDDDDDGHPPPCPQLEFTIEWVGPDKASEYLERNKNIRPITNSSVRALTECILLGKFTANNQAIGFDTSGNLIDGQHRLHAIILAKCYVWIAVCRGLETERGIDEGRTRPNSLVLSITNEEAGAANGIRALVERDTDRCLSSKLESYHTKFKAGILFATQAFHNTDYKSKAYYCPVALAYAPATAASLEKFVREVADRSVGVPKDSPAFHAREYVFSQVYKKDAVNVRMEKVLHCVYQYLQGSRMKQLKVQADNAVVEYFLRLNGYDRSMFRAVTNDATLP